MFRDGQWVESDLAYSDAIHNGSRGLMPRTIQLARMILMCRGSSFSNIARIRMR